MKKVLSILLINLLMSIILVNAQIDHEHAVNDLDDSISIATKRNLDFLQAEADSFFDSLKRVYIKYKKYEIPKDSIKDNWVKEKVGFSTNCDTLLFQNKYLNLQRFDHEITKYILNNSNYDTTIFQLDYRDNVNIETLVKSYEIMGSSIEKSNHHGVYYFTMYTPLKEKAKLVKTDTIDLCLNKVVKYNGLEMKHSDLLSLLKAKKPEQIVIHADKELPIQDLVDIIQIANNLKIMLILGTPR